MQGQTQGGGTQHPTLVPRDDRIIKNDFKIPIDGNEDSPGRLTIVIVPYQQIFRTLSSAFDHTHVIMAPV